MMLNLFIRFILNQLSAGGFSQNLGFYKIAILLLWIIIVQFKQKSGKYKIN